LSRVREGRAKVTTCVEERWHEHGKNNGKRKGNYAGKE